MSSEPIEIFNFGRRTYHLLRRSGIETAGDLILAIENGHIERIKGLGEKSTGEIINTVSGYKVAENEAVPKISKQNDIIDYTTDNNDSSFIREKLETIDNAIEELIDLHKETISKQIEMGILHKKIIIAGRSLEYLLKTKDVNRIHLLKIYINIIRSICITEELAYLTSRCSARDLNIIIARYGFSPRTYEEIGNDIGVTRERIRQILKRLEIRISGKAKHSLSSNLGLSKNALVRMQTALHSGEQQGLEITYDAWTHSLIISGLLGNKRIVDGFNHDPIELFISICNLLYREGIHEFSLPNNLQYAIQLTADELPGVPAKKLQVIRELPTKIRKEICRHTRFSGGVQARWLSREIDYELQQTEEILQALGYSKVNGDWFIPGRVELKEELNRLDVMDHSLRKLTQYCGPLSVENICSGIRHAISRTRYPAPTPVVMREILKISGYTTEENLYYWDGNVDEELSRGEEIILECLKKNGCVIHHAEIAQAFIDSELSFPSIHATLNRTPIIEKIDTGLYKLRGMIVSANDIERASNAGDRIPVNMVVEYEKTGKIKIGLSLGILAVGTGVIFSENLPNLVGKWKCVVGEKKFDEIMVTENEIRKLLKPISTLKCDVADRINFTFDTWTRTVFLEKVQNE